VKFWEPYQFGLVMSEFEKRGLPKACEVFWQTFVSKCNFFKGFSEHGFIVNVNDNHYYTIVIDFSRHCLSIEESMSEYTTEPPCLPVLKCSQQKAVYIIVEAMDAACIKMGTTLLEQTGKASPHWCIELKPSPQQPDDHSCGPISLDCFFHKAFEYMTTALYPEATLQRNRSPHSDVDWHRRRRFIAKMCYQGVIPGYLVPPQQPNPVVSFATIRLSTKTNDFCFAACYDNAWCSWCLNKQEDDMNIMVNNILANLSIFMFRS
jgi:hypothetical protein